LEKLEFGTCQGSHTKKGILGFSQELHESPDDTVATARHHISIVAMVDCDMQCRQGNSEWESVWGYLTIELKYAIINTLEVRKKSVIKRRGPRLHVLMY